MKEGKEVKEVQEVKEAEESNPGIAAFFDLDGTLMSLPSLERRFFRMLRYRQEIPLKNYFLWLVEALRLLPRGFRVISQANKMYLQGVRSFDESGAENFDDFSAHQSGRPCFIRASQAGGQESATPSTSERRNPRCLVPHFFEEAVERVAWHAEQGHLIAILSGTLEPLGKIAAQALEGELAACGIAAKICVRATCLEESRGRFTGRVLGDAVFGAAKAQAAKQMAAEMRLNLGNSFAYGDSANDLRLLAAVGNPAAVNPSRRLLRVARKRSWRVLRWNEEKELTQSPQRTRRRTRLETRKRKAEQRFVAAGRHTNV